MDDAIAGRRILFISPFDQARHAHAALVVRALERLECRVSALDPLARGPWWRRYRRKRVEDRIQRAVADGAPEIVLVVGTGHVSALAVHALREATSALWVNWIHDTATPHAVCEQAASAFDHLFVSAHDTAQQLGQSAGCTVSFLAPACDPSVHRPLRARDQFRANVVFAGTATPKREALLAELVEFGLAVWGSGWRKTSLRDYCRGELVDVQDYVRAYSGASVGVNIHHDEPHGGCNARLFELAAIGTPQVVDHRDDLPLHFMVGAEVVAFRQAEDLRSAVGELLHEHRLADEMGRAARRRALANHTYMHRMLTLLSALAGQLTPGP